MTRAPEGPRSARCPDIRTYGGRARTRTHSSIVAIVRDGQLIPSPTPSDVLRAGDVIVAVGTRKGLDVLARLLAHGPD